MKIARGLPSRLFCGLVTAFIGLAVVPAFATDHTIIGTTPNTTSSWNSTGSWNPASLPGSGDNAYITNALTGPGVLTVNGAVAGTTINFLQVDSPTANATNQLIIQNTFTSSFGFNLGSHGIIVVTNTTADFGINNFVTFNNSGNLFLKNGATVILNSSGSVVNVNSGTITMDTVNGSGTTTFNYINTSAFSNANTIVKLGAAGGVFLGTATGTNRSFINTGTINVQAGQLIINPGDAFSNNGFDNDGTIIVNNGTFTVDRSANSWAANNNGVWSNRGTVVLNNGTYTLRKAGLSFTVGTNSNFGTFMGSGNLRFNVNNDGGTLYGSNGTLVVEGNLVGSTGGTLKAGDATGAGTISFQGGNAGNGGTISGSMTITNNSAIVFGGDSSWTLNSAAAYGGSSATDRGSIISSNATGASDTVFLNNSAYQNNNGTLMVVNGNGINYGQIGGDFTNSFVMTGVGSFTGQFGANNQAIVNKGTIAAVQGGVLTLDPRDANNAGGVSNTALGTIIINNASTLAIVRSNAAWNGSSPIKNSGTILLNNGTLQTVDYVNGTANTNDTGRFLHNDGTIIAQGQGTSTNTIQASLDNAGTVYVTNDTAVLSVLGTSGLTNLATGQIILGGNGANGTMQATNVGRLVNAGLIQGQGTLTLGVDANGANASLTNAGTIVATNFGATAQGTLTINTGNAFSNGGLLNGPAGTIAVGTNMTLVFNRTANAWTSTGATAVNAFSNSGTILMQGGTFMTAAGGVMDTSAVRTNVNTGTITGWGTFQLLVTNGSGGQVLADARGLANRNQGTLTVSLTSFTNNLGSTLGTIGTNSTLNLLVPTGNTLVNFGTVQFSAGNIAINGSTGIISNYFAIAGVGTLTSLPVVQVGSSASLIAKTPTDGFSALVATVNPTNLNGQLLGAVGGAELRLTVSGGGNAIVNQGSMNIQTGGSISINGSTGLISNDVNGIFFGSGTNANTIVTSSIFSKIQASNGVLVVGLGNNINTGSLEAFSGTDQLVLTNTFVVNQGTMKANTGTVDIMGNGTITNSGTILGAGTYDDSIVNAAGGFIIANAQTQTLASATSSFLNQTGGVILVTGGTLNVDVNAWNNQGSITNATGAVLTRTSVVGVLTNSGVIVNLGSIGVQVVNNANITNSGGTFVLSVTNNASILSSQGSFTGSTFANMAGGTFKGTNTTAGSASTNFITSTTVLNTGTMIGGTAGSVVQFTNLTQNFVNQGTMLLDSPSTATNLAFYILRTGGTGDFTNDVSGVIEGAGILSTADSVSSGKNFNEWNKGTIIATNGTLILQPGDAFNNGGFVNMAGATAIVASASTLGIQRTDNAWASSGTVPRNEGVIQLNGGSFDFFGSSPAAPSLANDRSLSNAATGQILGNGTIEAGILNAGSINVNNGGTLYVDNSKTATGPNVWGIQNLGSIVINTNNTLVLNRNAADWAANEGLNNSGTLRFNGGVYVGAIAGTVNRQVTNFVGAGGTGGIYGNGTFDTVLDAQSGTLSAENGTLNFTHAVLNNVGNAVTAQAIGSGNVLQFFGGASLSASSTLKANSGGEVRFVGTTNSTVAGAFDNTGGFLTITGASTVFFTNNLARANQGTITLSGAGNLNYGGVGDLFTNAATGTIRATGSGGGTITGVLGANNFGFVNNGSLIAGAGSTLTIDPRDAQISGFSNAASGHIIVQDAAASFIITRTTTAWGSADLVKNEGTITINGGTFATFNTGGTSPTTTRVVQNDGVVEGSGFFRAALTNFGTLNVSGGTLSVSRLENEAGGVININTGSTLTNTDLIAPGWRNLGTVNVNNGTLSGNGTFENRGVINVSNTGTLLASGQFRNFGNIVGQNANVNFVSVTNNTTGFILISNSVLNVTSSLRNIGSITLFNSTGNLNQVFNNSGALMTISNSGAVASSLNVAGTFTNNGVVQFFHSAGTFASGAVNSGGWITDPTTNIFQNTFTVTSGGYVQMSAGDTYIFTNNGSTVANFVNLSTNNTQNNMLGGKFVFDATLSITQHFTTAAQNIGNLDTDGGFNTVAVPTLDVNSLAQYSNNFALGTLELDDTSLEIDGGTLGDALFLTNLDLDGAAQLIISNGVQVYFITSNDFSHAQVTLLGDGGLHQLTGPVSSVVPEPGVAFLWFCGFVTVYAARRRARNQKRD